jgi:hypothetical protein
MAFGIFLLVIIFIMWQLLVKGWLWKIMIGIFGWLGMYMVLISCMPGSRHTCLTVLGGNVSWAATLSTIVLIMAMLHTKE